MGIDILDNSDNRSFFWLWRHSRPCSDDCKSAVCDIPDTIYHLFGPALREVRQQKYFMGHDQLIDRYLYALKYGDFQLIGELAAMAEYTDFVTPEELFGKEALSRISRLSRLGFPDIGQYWNGLIRIRQEEGATSYVAGGRLRAKTKLMKGRVHEDNDLALRLVNDAYYDPGLSSPIHWVGPAIVTVLLKLPIVYSRRAYLELTDPGHTRYGKAALKELIAEAYPTRLIS